ncbi:hypothetical protein EGW08_007884 [Elysia chlorotica]|uniref:BESS domain-containing protein n=1 Tax=Elysia chlorotica TaxID=188477 RepID=A0A433TRY6_ELYCH|nr:hypothetical protein EGW08_007884 [Elysia chlorotica]
MNDNASVQTPRSPSQTMSAPRPTDLNPLMAMALTKTMQLQHRLSVSTGTRLSPGGESNQDFQTFVVNMDASSSDHLSPSGRSCQRRGENDSDSDTDSFSAECGKPTDDSVDCGDTLKTELDGGEECHFDIVGKYVVSKLRILPNMQRIYAEKLIMNVLLEAELGNLCRNSDINGLGS